MIMIHPKIPKIPIKGNSKMANKVYSKKLTNSGGGVCFLTGAAAVFALCAAAVDFIAGAVYVQFYERQIYDMTPDPIDFVSANGNSIALGVFALIMFVKALNAGKAKYMSREFGLTGVLMGLAFSLKPLAAGLQLQRDNGFNGYFETDYDSDKFRGAMEICRYSVPLLVCLLLLIAGIAVLAKLGGEDFTVEVPVGKKTKKSVPAQKEEESAIGFGGGTQAVQGLTGETKPATYSGNTEENAAAENVSVNREAPQQTQKRPTVKLCPNCGELVGEDELFCASCGQKM